MMLRFLLLRFLPRRLVPIVTVIEIAMLVRRWRTRRRLAQAPPIRRSASHRPEAVQTDMDATGSDGQQYGG
jgi:hypothetical protein